MPPCAVKTCAVRPVFARVVGELRAAAPLQMSKGPLSKMLAQGNPRRRWKPGLEQHPEPENQDSQHMLNEPRGSCPETLNCACIACLRAVCVVEFMSATSVVCDVPVTGGGGFRSPYRAIGSPYGGIRSPLRASFNCLIVGLGPGASNSQGFGVSLRM